MSIPHTGRLVLRYVGRFFLVLFTTVLLAFVVLCMVLNVVFNGPSLSARKMATMAMLESSAMKWVPAVFIGADTVDEIRASASVTLPDDASSSSQNVVIPDPGIITEEWANHPDGIRIEEVHGDTYNAYVMIIRDPSTVYLSTSTDKFSTSIPGTRPNQQMETEKALACINAGAFYDNGSSSAVVGSVPEGLVISGGTVRWTSGKAPQEGFVGLNKDNILIVAKTMTSAKATELGIRDGCCFGPVLIMDGQVNEEAYNVSSGTNPRTAIGQRADGAVIFLAIDGRQAGSLGGTYADAIDIMVEYGAVNACNLDGGSSTVMYYRDTYGLYGEAGQVQMINHYSLLQSEPRRMPTFFMVRASGSEG